MSYVHICSVFLNMCAAIIKPDSEQLFDIIEGQQGYFTTAQAVEAGYSRSTHTYHVEAGNWLRENRGIYRLKRYPQTDDGQLVLWSLWTRNREGKEEGVYSHLTALRVNGLSDVNPSRIDMTVPPGFRRNSAVPPVLVLHRATLPPDEIIRERGYSVTTPMRAIVDLAVSGEADRGIIKQALNEGRSRGLITRKQIIAAHSRPDVPDWLQQMMEAAD
jgi:predicted transcriptional regulator of viral defense system